MDVKRLTPFTHREKNTLTQLFHRFDVLKSKSMDGNTISKKNEAWHKVACLFNVHPETNVKRTPRQLRKLWNNMKQRKQAEAKIKQLMGQTQEIDHSADVKVEDSSIIELFDVGDGYRNQESILVPQTDDYLQQQRALHEVRLSILKEQLLKAKAETERAHSELRRSVAEAELAALKLEIFKKSHIS